MAIDTVKRMAQYADLARQAYKLRHADQEQVQLQARRHLIERMGKMRGLPQKLGQMLSFSQNREQDDPLSAADYAKLQESAEPLPLEAVLPAIEAAWQRPLDDVLCHIEPHAHAASLGQVHRAVTHDGREVAIKVQYPGIRQAVMGDLKLLGWLSAPVGNLRRGFDLAAYRRVILDDLEEELDYTQEAAAQRAFAEWAEADPFLIVPRVVDELSSQTVLVSEWQEGQLFSTVRDQWPERERKQLARGLLAFFLEGLFRRGMLHADLHPGNLRFLARGNAVELLLYDFGCVYRPDDGQRLALLRLIRATKTRGEAPLPLLLKLGFDQRFTEPLADKLPALCQVLFEPFCAEYPYRAADWRLGQRVSDILGEDRLNFRVAGPPALIFLLRAFHALAYYLEGLDAPVMWGRAIDPLLAELGPEMDALALPDVGRASRDFTSLATLLKIRVCESGRTKVQLTANASGIDDLDDLLDEAVREKIAARGIDLPNVVADVRRRGYAPGPVFELTDGPKTIEIWLE